MESYPKSLQNTVDDLSQLDLKQPARVMERSRNYGFVK